MSIDDITFPEARLAATREVLVRTIAAGPVEPRRRRRSTIIAIVIGAVTVPAGAATAYYYTTLEVEDTSLIRCFTDASLDDVAVYLDSGTNVDPVRACGELWSQGILRAGVPEAQEPTPGANLPVPSLATCVIDYVEDQAIVAVVPGDETVCRQLGLPRWAG